MNQPTQAEQATQPVTRDPVAAAIANASLLGVGYVLLGRRRLAVATGFVTVVLVTLLATVARSVWFEAVVVLWWAALIVHGWLLAGGRLRRPRRRGAGKQRLIALGFALPVLLITALVRFDAAQIERTTAEARGSGSCARALSTLDRVWLAHRLADAPSTARGDATERACTALREAANKLATALTGDTAALEIAYRRLSGVLASLPGHEKMVEAVLDRFLADLPTDDACATKATTDWLDARPARGDVLDNALHVVSRVAPPAIVACGDDLMATKDWERARARYQQLLDQYPDHELAAKAEEGATRALLEIELANVRGLLAPQSGGEPEYCTHPAPYSGATPVRKGLNRALVFGNEEHTGKLPPQWRASDAADAVLVICAGESEFGAPVATCPYDSPLAVAGSTDVTFRNVAIPVRVYEVRTGRSVFDGRVEITGSSCPPVVSYTYYTIDTGPPSEVYVTPSDSQIHDAFGPLINR